jgi:type IV pilus assembly protein PilC
MALTFDYKVRDRSGKLVEGQLEGDSLALVVGKLREMGYMPVAVTPKSGVNVRKEINIPWLSTRVKLAETAVATRQLATMVESGLSVVRALGLLAAQTQNKELARVLGEVLAEVERGSALSAAVAKYPKIFSNLFVTMVQAGEAGGNLDAVLLDLASTMEKQAALNRTIRSAMTYPAVVLSVMVIIFLALLIFIVPIFSKLFSSLGSKLPLPTQLMIDASHIVLSVWAFLLVVILIVAIVLFRKWIATDAGRHKWDAFKLRPPIFGPLIHNVSLARFTHTLGSLVQSGVPIMGSLDIVAGTSGNRIVGDALLDAKNGVREGRGLAEALREHENVIPPLVTQMIEVGEQTGALDTMLHKVGEFYDGEVENTVNNLTAMLEPILTVVMGSAVGLMVVCMYLPMFDYIKHVNAGGQ